MRTAFFKVNCLKKEKWPLKYCFIILGLWATKRILVILLGIVVNQHIFVFSILFLVFSIHKNLVFWMHKCLMEFWLFSQKNVWFTPRLDIRAKPKGNEVTTTKWMVGGGEKMVINFLCNKVICVCPSTLQAFHFGKNSSSVTKEKKKREPN